MICPICRNEAEELPVYGEDKKKLTCVTHGTYEVSDSDWKIMKGMSQAIWQGQFAFARATAKPGDTPVIRSPEYPVPLEIMEI